MRIWEMLTADKATLVVPVENCDHVEKMIVQGGSLFHLWDVLELHRPRGYKSKKLTNVVEFAVKADFILSLKGVDAVYDLVNGDAEFLPVRVEGKEYWYMHVTSVLDCIDYQRSEYRVYSDGRISSFYGLWFREDVIKGHNVFKIKDRPYGSPYVSEAFKKQLDSLDDAGLRFVLVWDSDLSEPIRMNPFH